VPQTEEEAAYHAHEYVKEDEAVKLLEAEEAQELADVRQRYADRKKPHADARAEHFELAHAWAEANRGNRKTIKLPNGRELQWRLSSSPSLVFDESKLWGIVKELLKLENWSKYLKIELKKNSVKTDLPELHKASGNLRRWLRLNKTEFFRIS
jgi:hypothetical protein